MPESGHIRGRLVRLLLSALMLLAAVASAAPQATPRVISSWQYDPTPFWGAFVKKALEGEKFEVRRLR